MQTDSFAEALERLDPASRALLDLSLRRGMLAEEIADVLGADPDSVAASRDEALRRVAGAVGMGHDEQVDEVRARLAELPADDWLRPGATNGNGNGNGNGAAPAKVAEPEPADARRIETTPVEPLPSPVALIEPADKPQPEADEAPEAEEAAPAPQVADEPAAPAATRRRRWPILLGLLVVAGVVAAIVLGSTGGSASKAPASASPSQPPQQAPQPKATQPKRAASNVGAKLVPVGRPTHVAGVARIAGRRLVLNLTGLPAPRGGYYEVWLYDSLIDAYSIGRSPSGHVKLNVKLPADWKRYSLVDISLEPNDGNVSHSGQSVARVPVRRLAR